MSEKKSKVYAVEGVTFDKVSFSFENDKLIGVSERTARNRTFKPISPSDPDFNTLINSDQAKRAFNIAKHGANQVAYVGEDKIIPKILAISNNRTDTRIYVRGDRTINYGRVLEVMGMLSGAGFSKVALISEPYQN